MTNDTATPSLPPSSPGRWRIPLLVAAVVLAVIVVTVVVVSGDDDEPSAGPGSDPTSSSPTSEAPSASEPSTEAPSDTAVPSAEPSEAEPTSSPIINAAVRDAIDDGFPALVPSGVPVGWTVVTAAYVAKGGGQWNVVLTDADGNPVTLTQTTAPLQEHVRDQLGNGAQQSGTVDLGAYGTGTWKVFTAGDQVGIATTIAKRTSALVAGLGQDSPVELAEQLLTAEDANLPEAG
jgi:hypothetical protein